MPIETLTHLLRSRTIINCLFLTSKPPYRPPATRLNPSSSDPAPALGRR